MRKKSKHIGRLFMLRSVGDESVDILFIMGDNGKSLSDELVCDSDHGEFSRLPVLPEPQDSLSLYLERLRIHLLSVESYEPSVDLVCLDRGEHGSGEVLYLQRILKADGYPCFGKQIDEQRTVIACGF